MFARTLSVVSASRPASQPNGQTKQDKAQLGPTLQTSRACELD